MTMATTTTTAPEKTTNEADLPDDTAAALSPLVDLVLHLHLRVLWAVLRLPLLLVAQPQQTYHQWTRRNDFYAS